MLGALTLVLLPLAAARPLVPTPAPAAPQETVKEPRSKVRFPVRLTALRGEHVHVLAGVGLRTKTIFKVKVYAAGLYVDGAAAAAALSAWKGRDGEHLDRDASFRRAVVEGQFGKTLRLVMTRDVDSEDMVEAFDEVLKPRIVRAQKRWQWTGGLEALGRFRRQFDLKELKKGTELVFTLHPDGRLVTSVGGRIKGEIESRALGWALFDAYLGDDPVQKDMREKLLSRFPGLLANPPEAPEESQD